MVFRRRNMLELFWQFIEPRWIDTVCHEAIFFSSSSPNRQATAYALRGSVVTNPLSDDRNRARATLMSYLSARIKASDKTVKLSIMGGSIDG